MEKLTEEQKTTTAPEDFGYTKLNLLFDPEDTAACAEEFASAGVEVFFRKDPAAGDETGVGVFLHVPLWVAAVMEVSPEPATLGVEETTDDGGNTLTQFWLPEDGDEAPARTVTTEENAISTEEMARLSGDPRSQFLLIADAALRTKDARYSKWLETNVEAQRWARTIEQERSSSSQ